MHLKILDLTLMVIITLGGGTWGTYFIATWKTISRPLRDCASMTVLFGSLLMAGILIVLILIKLERQSPSKP